MHKEFKSLPKKYASLDFEGIEFPVSKKGYHETEMKCSVSVNVFGYKNKQLYAIYRSNKSFKNYMRLLLLGNENRC